MTPVRYHLAAEDELLNEIGYLELCAPGLGRRFYAEALLASFNYNLSQARTMRYVPQETTPRTVRYGAMPMGLTIAHEPAPLGATEDGVVRVGGTRVTLDSVVAAFEDGATAEEIVQQYPSLLLADTYAVIGYYLRHRSEVEAYLAQRREQSARVRQQNVSRFDPAGVRARLLARRSK